MGCACSYSHNTIAALPPTPKEPLSPTSHINSPNQSSVKLFRESNLQTAERSPEGIVLDFLIK